ncbi:methylenetetrahydrofolate reductase [Apilactobacillus timberlakei]|uniref:methylenetetrahydrofolate reductase n=1 Tax=Apilactobacillus timberlakei TaxID=2008380 RepID=UPI001126E799|nr:methylenetetrahydrofolate reductase [Apilactobacillus timberlakei]TPR14785.1 methylenetetrahydrofolate reductase [NAD(P)H] [Apilactobacillus timberlakei]
MSKQTLSVEIAPDMLQIKSIRYYLNKWHPDFVSISNLSRFSFDSIMQCANYVKKEINIPVIIHITGINRDRNEIDRLLTHVHNNNIHNLLLLRGDNHGHIKNDFPYASELVKYVKSKNDEFKIMGACYPEVHPEAQSLVEDIQHLKTKVNAGCNQLISQMFFDNQKYYQFIDETKKQNINVPILAGIMPITEMQTVNWLKKIKMDIPQFIQNNNDIKQAGIKFTIEQINDLYKNNVDGIHLYTMNNWSATDEIIKNIKRSELNE